MKYSYFLLVQYQFFNINSQENRFLFVNIEFHFRNETQFTLFIFHYQFRVVRFNASFRLILLLHQLFYFIKFIVTFLFLIDFINYSNLFL